MSAGRVAPRAAAAFALTALFVGASALGFGLIPAQSASALVPPPTSPGSLASETAAGTGHLTDQDIARIAGSGDVFGGAKASGAGSILQALELGFLVGARGVQIWAEVTGTEQAGLCDTSSSLAKLYGQDCSKATIPNPVAGTPAQQNTDQAQGISTVLCDLTGGCLNLTSTVIFDNQHNATPALIIHPTGDALQGYDGQGEYQLTYLKGANSTRYGSGINSASRLTGFGFVNLDPNAYYALDGFVGATCVSAAAFWPDGGNCDSTTGLPSSDAGAEINTATATSADPARIWLATVTFADGSTMVADSDTFHESDANLPGFPVVPNPGGLTVTEMNVQECLPDATQCKPVVDQQTSPAYQQAATLYPACAIGGCALTVYVGGAPCAVGDAACVDWIHDDPVAKRIECEYGPPSNPTLYNPPLSECYQLAPYYNPSHVQDGTPYAKPDGSPVAKPSAPSSEPAGTPSGGIDGSGGQDCLGQSVTANPVTWVTGPVKCAMQWAFVPTDAQADFTRMQDDWAATPGARVAAAASAWTFVPPGTGCGGVIVSLQFIRDVDPQAPGTLAVGAACPGDPLAPWAGWASLFLSVVIVVTSTLAIVRIVSGVVSYDSGAVGE